MVKFVTKEMFFDRKAVESAYDKAARKALSKFGAFVRTTARRSMRPAKQMSLADMSPAQRRKYDRAVLRAKRDGRKKPKRPRASSKPGEPPRVHSGLLKKWILFGYDKVRQSVVIGPLKLNTKFGHAPQALEFGGTVQVAVGARKNRRVLRRIKIEPRPYMGPALDAELPKLMPMWKNAVIGTA